jgi:hypothetical protein
MCVIYFMSLISYGMFQAIRDTRVFRGSEIDSDHYLLESSFNIKRNHFVKKKKKKH